ncbi:DMT family transporter [Vibrio mediterranei]|uniref:DMT family transporter n=1 Tax=Vibrio barjaei TaxID=1676683 RepID=UPI0007BC21A1|nr:DMT family transporter [Vibrio barjaei]MCG9789426.1 DMT family transporter [Vibrio mediterranei]OIN26890.1 multidrug DMT transporter permease [Vibrio barjaei]
MSNAIESSQTSSKPQYVKGLMFALSGAALFSLKPILIKIAFQYGGDATTIMSLRAFSSLPFYLLVLCFLCRSAEKRQQVRRFGWQAALVGVLGYYVASYLDIAALEFISAQLERLLIFLFPSFVVLFSWVFLGQAPSKLVLKAVGIGYLGIGFIIAHDLQSFGREVWKGSGLAIASAIVFAAYLMLSKNIISKMGSELFTSIGMGSAGLAILVHLSLSEISPSDWSFPLILLGIILGIFCTVLPSYLIAAGMARLTATELSVTSNIGPGITALAAVLVLGEAFTVYHAVGLCLVLYSVYSMKQAN